MKVMEDEEIGEWVRYREEESLEEVVGGMVDEANRRGAPDNVTVALLSVQASPFPDPSS
jgi:serine/threonine protein phosphatase PrpC